MSCYVKIVVLLNESEFAKGKYVVSIDVVPADMGKSIIQTRADEEGFILEECLGGTGMSPDRSLQLTEGTCSVRFEVTSALKPLIKYMEDENVLEFTKGTKGCRTITTLVRNPDDESTTASIVFYVQKKFLHRVIIADVPLPEIEGRRATERWGEENLEAPTTADGAECLSDDAVNEALPYTPTDDPATDAPAAEISLQRETGNQTSFPQQPVPQENMELQSTTTHQADGNGLYTNGLPVGNDEDTESVAGTGGRMDHPPTHRRQKSDCTWDHLTMRDTVIDSKNWIPYERPGRSDSLDESLLDPDILMSVHHRQSSSASDDTSCDSEIDQPGSDQWDSVWDVSRKKGRLAFRKTTFADGDRQCPVCHTHSSSSFQDDEGDRAPDQSENPSSSARDMSPTDKALCDESLNNLAAALNPGDARHLFIGLGISVAIIAQANVNNHGDIVQAQFQMFRHWKQSNAEKGANNMLRQLLIELSKIGRSDFKMALETALRENRIVTRQELSL